MARMGDRRGAYRVLVRGDVAGVGDRRGAYRVLVGGAEEKWRSRREDNIRIINYKLNINNYFFSAVLTFYTVNINCIAIKCKN